MCNVILIFWYIKRIWTGRLVLRTAILAQKSAEIKSGVAIDTQRIWVVDGLYRNIDEIVESRLQSGTPAPSSGSRKMLTTQWHREPKA